jgi:hypothetical protein
MESAGCDRDAAFDQRIRDIESARKLVRLHAGQHHHAGAGGFDHPRELAGAYARIGFVERMDVDIDAVAEDAALGAVFGQSVKRGEGVRRNRGAQPLNDVAGLVIMRRLHENETEAPLRCIHRSR